MSRRPAALLALALAPIIVSAPSGTSTDGAPTFAFRAEGPARCKLDYAPWMRCRSPYTALALVTGPHAFAVRSAGSAPASRGWTLTAGCEPQYGSFGAGRWPPACWRPYGNASPFNQPLPAHPRLARDSAVVVRRLAGWGPPSSWTAGEQDSADDFAHPTYFSRLADPRLRVECPYCQLRGYRIRIPSRARPAGGSDRHMTIVAQGSGREYDLWQARLDRRHALARVGGGGHIRISGAGLRSDATAAGFGNLAGIVRAQELGAGRIDHALFMVVHCDSSHTVFPARGHGHPCSAEGRTNRAAPPLGARFQLDMTAAQIRALGLPRWKQAIYEAMARYGLIVGDTGGGDSWSIQFESDSTYTSYGYPPLLEHLAATSPGWESDGDGRFTAEIDDPRIDWKSQLREIAPCVSKATC
jgi:hypothetical protein